ncbi:MAG: squalene/phytoene synthase family protein [Ardenticatenaceae bacterium]|nr:squalene/phytoene synthase family protein [Ardenticatenaceae bacterium]
MTLSQTWESTLLSLAQEATHSQEGLSELWGVDHPTLQAAYDYCDHLTAIHSRSFYWASQLLPGPKRRAVRALYAFCRITDDIVDHPSPLTPDFTSQNEMIKHKLEQWRQASFTHNPPKDDLVALAWADTRTRFNVPVKYGEQLINGVLTDLTKKRYATFDELAAYAYGVASTVGLMSMHIIGFSDQDAIPYAIKLGVALQLTNILRDVGEDWRNGRLYLPQDELAAFDLMEEDIDRAEVDDRWQQFMQFQIDRNRRLYAEAWSGISLLSPNGRFSIAAAADLYQGILDDIERHNYDVFSRRSFVSTTGKLRRLPSIWWRSREIYLSRSRLN